MVSGCLIRMKWIVFKRSKVLYLINYAFFEYDWYVDFQFHLLAMKKKHYVWKLQKSLILYETSWFPNTVTFYYFVENASKMARKLASTQKGVEHSSAWRCFSRIFLLNWLVDNEILAVDDDEASLVLDHRISNFASSYGLSAPLWCTSFSTTQ